MPMKLNQIQTNESQSESQAAREIIIAPSVIAADWWHMGNQVRAVENAGCRWLHFDAMDGHFVPNLTLGPMFLEAVRPHTKLHFDAHLMISNPADFVDEFIAAGADSVSVQVEGQLHLHRIIARIKENKSGKKVLAGAVLNPATPVSFLDAILMDLDYVLVMSVNPGFSGQKFLPLALQKIAHLKRLRDERELSFLIQVDGGVATATAPQVVAAGADILVCGSSVFNEKATVADNVRALEAAINEGERGG
jgi:ribulose-phosphate 3-epimerase